MADFKPNHAGLGELLNSDGVEAEMVRRAAAVMAAAEASAPFDPASKGGTHYRDAFRVEHRKHGGIHNDRAEASVVNDDDAAVYIEYGTGSTPKHRTLGHAIDAARD